MNELNKLGLDVIHPKKGDTILLRYEYGGDMEIEKIVDVMNAVKQMFPDNRVICVPWQMSPADLDELDVKENRYGCGQGRCRHRRNLRDGGVLHIRQQHQCAKRRRGD